MKGASAPGFRIWLLLTAFFSGFSVMVLEMAAVRAMAPYFGASTYTWTNVIGVILAALSVGYFLGGRLIDRRPRAGVLYGILLAGALLCLLLPLVVRDVSRWLLPAADAAEGAVDLVNRASLVATLILFAPPVFLLGMISPMTIRLLVRPGQVGDVSGRVFAGSTVGSILGTFATTFWLVPGLGTRGTLALAGAVLTGTAIVGLLLAAFSRRTVAATAGAAVAAVLLIVGVARAGPLKTAADGLVQIAEFESAYQYLRVVETKDRDGTPLRMLQINEAEAAYQSVMRLDGVLTGGRYYDYYSILPLLLGAPERTDLRVLVIGLATGTIPRQLRHFYPEGLEVTGVEIDPEVVEAGHEYFDLPRDAEWLDIRVADGRVFLNQQPAGPRYDLIVIDAFSQEYYIPFHLATEEAFREAKSLLREGGILAMNVASYQIDSRLLEAIEKTVANVFGRAWRVDVRGYPNWMVFAMKDAKPEMTRLVNPPRRVVPEWDDLRTIAAEAVTSAVEIEPPADGGSPLTDDRAPVERLTDESVRRESRAVLTE